jgi:hypothetical protein
MSIKVIEFLKQQLDGDNEDKPELLQKCDNAWCLKPNVLWKRLNTHKNTCDQKRPL